MSCDKASCLMCTSVGDNRLREHGQLLIVGSCVRSRYPDILEQYAAADGGYFVLEVCLEETHVNMAAYKIASMVKYADIRRLAVLTIDGSPHCVQAHLAVQDIKNHFIDGLEVRNYVIEKGKVYQISPESIKRARHLSKIEASLSSTR